MPSAICAIVVTYHPEPATLHRLLNQLNQSPCDFWVIDNHSNQAAELKQSLQAYAHCKGSTFLSENVGQAEALNQALESVRSAGYELALLFDQDSAIDPDFVSNMHAAWVAAKALDGAPLAALGPRLQDPRNGRRLPFRTFHQLLERKETPASATPP